MNILFLTLSRINSIEEKGLYQGLLRKFRNEGHNVYIVSPLERRMKMNTHLVQEKGVVVLNVKTYNIRRVNIIEKGLGTIAIENQYLKAIKKCFLDIRFDLILYSTPPITFSKIIKTIKNRDNAFAYLLLKDIFPQNAVDMKLMRKGGFIYKYFRKKEKELYQLSDAIGCMSPANVEYVKEHNTYLDYQKLEVNPNSIQPEFIEYTIDERNKILDKYNIPKNKKILVYGGNLGKPQGLEFLIELLENDDFPNFHFLIVGDGTMYDTINNWFVKNSPSYATLLNRLPKNDYDKLLAACDIGLIFLSKYFTIPNFPSRLLSYLEMKKPVIAITDVVTDIGEVIEKAHCGFKIISGDKISFYNSISLLEDAALYEKMSQNCWELLQSQYTVSHSYDLIMDRVCQIKE